ncbi:hypothetical protein DNTS_013870 [Danionella cerebrum]|uniref:Uncharacterized protein n=1 Tax=Danionella cerebrum TaxID=2873325 RepID=A0A553QBR9_9TELE|nr:hypothetical protein DNTS_013870 [Danionella translucida]
MSKGETDAAAVINHAEGLLVLAAALHEQCREESEHMAILAQQLRDEGQFNLSHSELLQQDMTEISKTLETLMDTKVAYEARERQARKLSKQL